MCTSWINLSFSSWEFNTRYESPTWKRPCLEEGHSTTWNCSMRHTLSIASCPKSFHAASCSAAASRIFLSNSEPISDKLDSCHGTRSCLAYILLFWRIWTNVGCATRHGVVSCEIFSATIARFCALLLAKINPAGVGQTVTSHERAGRSILSRTSHSIQRSNAPTHWFIQPTFITAGACTNTLLFCWSLDYAASPRIHERRSSFHVFSTRKRTRLETAWQGLVATAKYKLHLSTISTPQLLVVICTFANASEASIDTLFYCDATCISYFDWTFSSTRWM